MAQEQQPVSAAAGQIQIKASDEMLKGVYSNAMQVSHTPEEFTLDFMNILAGAGNLVGRLVVSPDHFKRIIAAMQDNLKRYEESFGSVKGGQVASASPSAPTSTTSGFGFDTNRSN